MILKPQVGLARNQTLRAWVQGGRLLKASIKTHKRK